MRPTAVDQVPSPIPYRLLLAGGWIDQPFVSRHNPDPVGSMVVVGLEADRQYMERSGFATSTRRVAQRLWPEGLPPLPAEALVRELYDAENEGRKSPSGSQDMIGIVYPGVSRLDYAYERRGGVFPFTIEACVDPEVAAWLQSVLHILPVAPRPPGYDPLAEQRLDPAWVARLGRSGRACFDAIVARDLAALGASLNETMACWEALLPRSLHWSDFTVDWPAIVAEHQARYPGAMMSASGGGYLFVASAEPVPGAFHPSVRLA